MNRFLGLVLLAALVSPVNAAEDLSHITDFGGTIYFADDFESGAQYRTSSARYGSSYGYWSYLGGAANGTAYTTEPSDCSIVTSEWASQNHMTHISGDTAGAGAVSGSTYSMKTPYWGNCNNESSTRDQTTILTGTPLTEYYIRWYQKWTGNWMNGSTQQKLFKHITSIGHSGGLRFGANGSSWKTIVPNNHVDATTLRWPGKTASVWVAASGYGTDDTDEVDDDDPNTTREDFQVDTWYCIEMHWKTHTAGNADGLYEAWVDGEKVFYLAGMVWGDNDRYDLDGTGVTQIEMQHIYYDRATNDDQPTYMDNIVIADRYIGQKQANINCSGGTASATGGTASVTIQ